MPVHNYFLGGRIEVFGTEVRGAPGARESNGLQQEWDIVSLGFQ